MARVHMHDLKDVTNNVHYENFRYSNLATVTSEGQKTKPVTTSKYVNLLRVVCYSNGTLLYNAVSAYIVQVTWPGDFLRCFLSGEMDHVACKTNTEMMSRMYRAGHSLTIWLADCVIWLHSLTIWLADVLCDCLVQTDYCWIRLLTFIKYPPAVAALLLHSPAGTQLWKKQVAELRCTKLCLA